MLRTIGVLAALMLAVVACTGPGASPSPAPTGTATPTASPTTAPTASPTSAASPTTAPSPTDGASPSPTGAATPSPSPSPTPPPGAVENTLTIWADELRVEVFNAIGQQFQTEQGVPVRVYQFGFGDIRTQMSLTAPNGEGPDIIVGAHDWLGELATAGVLAPIEGGAWTDNMDPVALQGFTYDGTLYGVPYATEAIALYYNTDLVPEAPATWDELKRMSNELETSGSVEQGYCLQDGDPYHSYPILTGMGGYIFGPDPTTGAYNPQDVGLDSAGGIAYANELDALVDAGYLKPGFTGDNCRDLLAAGDTAFWFSGPWNLPFFRDSDINFGVAPIPSMAETARPFIGVQGMMVNFYSPNVLVAQTFLTEYMASDAAMQAIYDADQRAPAWLPTAQGVTDELLQAFVASAANGNPMPAIPEMGSVWGDWTTAINNIALQQGTPEENVRNAATNIRESIGE